jgi:peptide/nickel transport system substrate-binding protein
VLSEERVRRAISLAIDQQDLIRAAGGDEAGILCGMAHPTAVLTQEELRELTKPDLAEARRLMSAAGQEDGFDLSMTVASTSATSLDVAALMKQQLAEIDINLKLDPQEMATFVRKLFDITHESMLIPVWTGTLDPGQNFHGSLRTGSGQNWWKVSIPEIDELDDKQLGETDIEKRTELIRELERLNFEKLAALPLFALNGWIALWNHVRNYDHLRTSGQGAGDWQDSEVWLDT